MIVKLLILGLVSSSLTQTLPSSNATTSENEQQLPCEKKLEWHRDAINEAQSLFEQYYSKYLNLNTRDNLSHVIANHGEFQQRVFTALNRYQKDSKTIRNISNETDRKAFCVEEIKWFRTLDKNLTQVAATIKNDLLLILHNLSIPNDVKAGFDQILTRFVNFLFVLDISRNLYKDVKMLAKKAFSQSQAGIELEKQSKIGKSGIENERTSKDILEYEEALNDDDIEKEITNNLKDLENNKVGDKTIAELEENALRAGESAGEAAAEAAEGSKSIFGEIFEGLVKSKG